MSKDELMMQVGSMLKSGFDWDECLQKPQDNPYDAEAAERFSELCEEVEAGNITLSRSEIIENFVEAF